MSNFARSVGVGGAATAVDFGALTLLVELATLSPELANVPALLAGATVQFLGCRHLVFGAGHRRLPHQLAGFVLVEVTTLALNGLVFHLLVTQTPVPYPLARALGTFLVFTAFSYPLWHRVFR
jgi:putative flippase GtrA